MQAPAKDHFALNHIQELVAEEHCLYGQATRGGLSDAERARLNTVTVALNRCRDMLRQRREFRSAERDPSFTGNLCPGRPFS